MTNSRTSTEREIFGMIGKFEKGTEMQAEWNRFFTEKRMDAFMDRYPTTITSLPERLSEMFHFDRRGYIVGILLQKAIIPLLDRLDSSAEKEGRVDTVVNERGVMVGFFLGDVSLTERYECLLERNLENERSQRNQGIQQYSNP